MKYLKKKQLLCYSKNDDDDRDDVPFYINLESINISSICFFRLIASFSAA